MGIFVVLGFSKKTVINRYLLLWPSVSNRAVDSLLTALPEYLHIRKLKYTSFARDVVIVVFDITVHGNKNLKESVTLIQKLKFTQYKKRIGNENSNNTHEITTILVHRFNSHGYLTYCWSAG